ncbi:UDP-N-acetylglucosamine 2-epimerase [Nocardioides sp. URHA0020]|uniref:UDP-N-acetylglucosamine 2-epimerase n=1 Tax=Nocardioides sp. URHA0020 TaxID=1380392 RepID=UPI0006860B26|nr:UDP-N-acetylglucosamine 2-epimerase [Nocardioides sp. URHA0020]
MRVGVFVGTRADLGPLQPVLAELASRPEVETVVLTGLAFDADDLARRLEGSVSSVIALASPLGEVDLSTQLRHGPAMSAGAGRAVVEHPVERLVVLGDRWELLYVVPPYVLAGVPVVHLHGGEVTSGAIDERVRHAVTKLADVHCVASQDAADRVAQMGEEPERIHVTGAPGLDRLAAQGRLDDTELEALLGVPVRRPLALFTYHPPTASGTRDSGRWAEAALRATLEVCGTVVATHPGMDAGRNEVLAALTRVEQEDDRVLVVEALGPRYPAVLASCDVVVGNSSSGVIEAASVGVPAVDVGLRQHGRLRADNVWSSDEGEAAVGDALRHVLAEDFRLRAARVVNPYGDGTAARRIVDVVLADPPQHAKHFVDRQPALRLRRRTRTAPRPRRDRGPRA